MQVGGRPAAVLDIGERRVLVQLPVELPPGQTTVVMTVRGAASAPASIRLEPYAPVLLRLSREPPLGDVLHSCQPGAAVAAGEIVTAIATGLGATNPVVPTGARAPASPPAATLVKPKISVLWQEAEVLESVLIPGEIGLYRIRFRVPPGDGWHPMALHIAGYDSFPLILPVGSGLINVSAPTWQNRSDCAGVSHGGTRLRKFPRYCWTTGVRCRPAKSAGHVGRHNRHSEGFLRQERPAQSIMLTASR